MSPSWVRRLRDICVEQNVPFFFKQWGGMRKKTYGRELDGRFWKGHTLYVRPDDVPETEAAIENYGRFRSLCRRWIELEVELARCRRAEASGKAHKL